MCDLARKQNPAVIPAKRATASASRDPVTLTVRRGQTGVIDLHRAASCGPDGEDDRVSVRTAACGRWTSAIVCLCKGGVDVAVISVLASALVRSRPTRWRRRRAVSVVNDCCVSARPRSTGAIATCRQAPQALARPASKPTPRTAMTRTSRSRWRAP